jgi:hypothetical protein
VLRGVGRREVAGGELVQTDRWVPREEIDTLCATQQAVEGITGVDGAVRAGTLITIAARHDGLASGPA